MTVELMEYLPYNQQGRAWVKPLSCPSLLDSQERLSGEQRPRLFHQRKLRRANSLPIERNTDDRAL